jgi:hypothetical protein
MSRIIEEGLEDLGKDFGRSSRGLNLPGLAVNPEIMDVGKGESGYLHSQVTKVPDINVSKDAGGTGRGNLAKYGSRAAGTVAVAGITTGAALYAEQGFMSRLDADLASAGNKIMQIPATLLPAVETVLHDIPHPTLPTGLPSFGGAWSGSLTTVLLVGIGAFVLYESVRLFS